MPNETLLETQDTNAGRAAKLLTTNEACAFLGIGKRTIQERVAARELAIIKIGKLVRFHPDDLRAFIDKKRVKATGWRKEGGK
jgi:excisionase family DNA binding protein